MIGKISLSHWEQHQQLKENTPFYIEWSVSANL